MSSHEMGKPRLYENSPTLFRTLFCVPNHEELDLMQLASKAVIGVLVNPLPSLTRTQKNNAIASFRRLATQHNHANHFGGPPYNPDAYACFARTTLEQSGLIVEVIADRKFQRLDPASRENPLGPFWESVARLKQASEPAESKTL